MAKDAILVATDFSARADRAVERAIMLACESGSEIDVVHALEHKEVETVDRSSLDRQMREVVGTPDCETVFLYPEGSAPKAIAKVSEDIDPRLIVVGPARYNTLGDFFLGTAVDYVLRNTTRPVLVVKKRARQPYKHMVAGTDFSAGSAHAIIEAARLFPDCAVHVVHGWRVPFEGWQRDRYVREQIQREDREYLDEFMENLAKREPRLASATSSMTKGSAHLAIMNEIEARGEGLAVVGSHGTSGFKQAALGSVTSDLLRTLPVDVLVVNTRDAGAKEVA